MTYDEAIASTVSLSRARAELESHGFLSYVIDGVLVATDQLGHPEEVAKVVNGQVKGSEILDWLGY